MDKSLLLTEADYVEAANLLRCKVSNVKAVSIVESAGDGFLADGRVKILFEGHHFHRYTKGAFDKTHPTVSYPEWTTKFYAKGATASVRGDGEWKRFTEAYELNANAAMLSASYGKFQIMGFNFALCGFSNITEFVGAMAEGERQHLLAFCQYVIHANLAGYLRAERWDKFAEGYNGPAYKRNDYAGKLFRANLKCQ